MASMIEIMKRGAELTNSDEEFKAQMVELDGDIIFWRFEDDQPAVTTRLDKGVIVVEEGENPDSQIGMIKICDQYGVVHLSSQYDIKKPVMNVNRQQLCPYG